METRIVLVGRAAMVRECFRTVLAADPALVVAAELPDLVSLEAWLDGHDADVAVFDPSGCGFTPSAATLAGIPPSRIGLVVAGTTLQAEWREAGAASALPRNASPADLRAGVANAARPLLAAPETDPPAAPANGTWGSLSRRQREVLLLASQGQSSRKIADSLGIGTRTVETHRTLGMRRLGVRSYYELLLRVAGTHEARL